MENIQLPNEPLVNGKTAYAIYCQECEEFSGCEIDGIQRYCPAEGRCHDFVCPEKQGYRFVIKFDICPMCFCSNDESFLSKDGLHIPMRDREFNSFF